MALTAHEEIDEEEVDTLGGLVFMLSGHVPVRGEVIQHPEGVEFEVLDAPWRGRGPRACTARLVVGDALGACCVFLAVGEQANR